MGGMMSTHSSIDAQRAKGAQPLPLHVLTAMHAPIRAFVAFTRRSIPPNVMDEAQQGWVRSYAFPSEGNDSVTALNFLLMHVQSGKLPLGTLVSGLGEYLTSKDEAPRVRGTLLLAEVLARLPKLDIPAASLRSLLAFFCARLQDYPCAKEVLMGLHSLTVQRGVPAEQADLVCKSLFSGPTIQSLPQSARGHAFALLERVVTQHRAQCIAIGEEFIKGFIHMMDGERDPRNLIGCFRLARFCLTAGFNKAEVAANVEELFDITSCYFPITFTAPKNDPFGVTGDDLVLELRRVFCSHVDMAEFVFPLLLEKLESDAMSVKLDALRSISACATSYGGSALGPYLEHLWQAVKKEALYTSEEEAVSAALECIQALLGATCPDRVGGFAVSPSMVFHWEALGRPLLQECTLEMRAPGTKLSRLYAKILIAAAGASANASMRVLKHAWPKFSERFFSQHLQPSQRLALLELVAGMVKSVSDIMNPGKQGEAAPSLPQHPLEPYVEDLMHVYSSALIGGFGSQRAAAVKGLCALATIGSPNKASSDSDNDSPPSLLSAKAVRSVVATATRQLCADDSEDARHAALESLVVLARAHPLHVLQHTLPDLFSIPAFSGAKPSEEEKAEQKRVAPFRDLPHVLHAVSELASAPRIFEAALPHLMALVRRLFADALQGRQSAVQSIHEVLSCVATIVTRAAEDTGDDDSGNADSGHMDDDDDNDDGGEERPEGLQACVSSFPPTLVSTLVRGATLLGQHDPTHQLDAKVVRWCVVILATVSRVAPAGEQRALASAMLSLFLGGDAEALRGFELPASAQGVFRPLEPNAPAAQLQLVPLLTAVVASLKPATQQELEEPIGRLVGKLLGFLQQQGGESSVSSSSSISSSSGSSNETSGSAHELAALQCLAAVVNRFDPAGADLEQLCQGTLSQVQAQACDATVASEQRQQAVRTLTWVLKALVMSGSSHASSLRGALCELLGDKDEGVSRQAAAGFDVVMRNEEACLSAGCRASIVPLYKQRFFYQTLGPLLESFKSASAAGATSSSQAVLLALSFMLRHLPKPVLLEALPMTLPLMIQSLSSPLDVLRESTLATITKLVQDAMEAIGEHVSSLVPVLLQLCRHKPSTRVRLSAIVCLEALTALPFHKVYPHKRSIENTLAECLDDHKRLVRKAAVRCRNLWAVLSENV